jgi:pimeloyl-ACP methyl ester carboxylesterase
MKHLSIVAIVFLLSGCMSAYKILEQEKKFFKKHVADNPSINQHSLSVAGGELFYTTSGDPQKPTLILIHGTPGDWEQHARYLLNKTLLESFYIISIDRPGWGRSTLEGKHSILNFEGQAAKIVELVRQRKTVSQGKAVVLMGHSLGASLAPRLAMDYPQFIDGLLLIAGTLSPEYSSPRWFNYFAKIPGVYWIVGKDMAKANKEIFALKENIKAMHPQWDKVKAFSIVVQGKNDNLVNPANLEFARESLNVDRSQFISLDDGHLIPFTRVDDVVNWSICLLKKVKTQKNQC